MLSDCNRVKIALVFWDCLGKQKTALYIADFHKPDFHIWGDFFLSLK